MNKVVVSLLLIKALKSTSLLIEKVVLNCFIFHLTFRWGKQVEKNKHILKTTYLDPFFKFYDT